MRHAHVVFCLVVGLFATHVSSLQAAFSLEDKPGESLDVVQDGKIVARFNYAHDTSTPERHHETYKPYLHIFDAEGHAPITKGAGGNFTHHRGIFVGWNQIKVDGKTYDRWHMPDGDMVHQTFSDKHADADSARFTSTIYWMDDHEKPILEEQRTLTFRPGPPPIRLMVDVTSTIKAVRGDTVLDGDPEHAGVQYRPANEIALGDTVYVYPREGAKPHDDLDYPWVGESYTLGGKRYSIVEINSPGNPTGTRFSAYRDYGRFGAFPTLKIKSGDSQTLRYRFLIIDGEMPKADVIQKIADDYTGAATPTPAPPVTVQAAEKS